MSDAMIEIRRERETEARVRAMDAGDIVNEIHSLEDRIAKLEAEDKKREEWYQSAMKRVAALEEINEQQAAEIDALKADRKVWRESAEMLGREVASLREQVGRMPVRVGYAPALALRMKLSHTMLSVTSEMDTTHTQPVYIDPPAEPAAPKVCTYPDCNCPFDMGADNKCLRGYPPAEPAGEGPIIKIDEMDDARRDCAALSRFVRRPDGYLLTSDGLADDWH